MLLSIHLSMYSPTHILTHSPTHHSLTYLPTQPLTHLPTSLLTYLLAHSPNYLLLHTHSLTHPLTYWVWIVFLMYINEMWCVYSQLTLTTQSGRCFQDSCINCTHHSTSIQMSCFMKLICGRFMKGCSCCLIKSQLPEGCTSKATIFICLKVSKVVDL